ncbi:MAG: butyryl-CoA dehydrogenase [Anaerolineaceae bacterium 4572_78]|nr:MAG: butyryl-CoA dehydrogenase [Anaerolineaceae bacterium 4572_78]
MEFTLNEEQQMLQKTVRDFATKEILPLIKRHEPRHEFPHALIPQMAEMGLLGVCIPVRYGGAGFDYISLGIVSEALEWADSSVRETLAVHVGLNSMALFQWGTEKQKQKYLVPQSQGEKLACFGLTEPDTGSDVAGLKSKAKREGDVYFLSGEKTWITLADVADHFLIFAKTDLSAGNKGISAFIVERDFSGVQTGTLEGKLGVWASNTGWIRLDNTEVPLENRLGEEGEGFKIAMSCLDNARYSVAAGAMGIVRYCLDASVAYATERTTFGKPIGQHQLVQQLIAKMAQSLMVGRLLTAKIGWLKNQGIRNTLETSMAKWYNTEAAFSAASDAIQIHGAYGYSTEYGLERHLRNSKGAVIYEGTSQIHQVTQAQYALGYRIDKPLRCELPAYDAEYWQEEVSLAFPTFLC